MYSDVLENPVLCLQDNLRPKLFCSMTPRDYTSFVGNLSAADAFARLYYAEGAAADDGGEGHLLIGARNIMWVSLRDSLGGNSIDFLLPQVLARILAPVLARRSN